MAVSPLDVYRIVADPGIDADAKKQQIDMLYGIAAPTNGPDTRTAQVDPNSIMAGSGGMGMDSSAALSAAPVSMSDAGGMSAAPAATPAPLPAPVAAPAPSASGGVSSISPEELAAAAASKASTPAPVAAHAEAGGEPDAAEPTGEQDIGPGVRALYEGAVRGGPAHRVAAKDQPTASVVERANGVPDEVKQAIATDAEKEGAIAVQQGEDAATSHLNAAIGFDNQAHQARADAAKQAADQKAVHEHIVRMDTDFEQMVKDTAVKPSDWWTSKDTGHKVLALISAVMFGLASDPAGLQKAIDDDLADKRLNREKKLGAYQTKINDFRGRLMSPEAQEAAQRAFASQAVAAEANRLAEAAASPEARLRGQQLAQQFQTQFDRHTEEMAMREAGTIKTNIAHLPEHIVGGGGVPPLKAIQELVKGGAKFEDAVRSVMGGNYGGGEAPDEGKRRVTFGGGEQVGYVANEGSQHETQTMVNAISGLKGTYGRIRDLIKSGGHTLAGPEKAALQAQVANGIQQLQAMAKGEGANARMAGEMLEKLGPLTGASALETGTLDANAKAQIDEAYRIVDNQEETIKGTLTPSPRTAPSGGKIKTLGKSKKSLDFEKE